MSYKYLKTSSASSFETETGQSRRNKGNRKLITFLSVSNIHHRIHYRIWRCLTETTQTFLSHVLCDFNSWIKKKLPLVDDLTNVKFTLICLQWTQHIAHEGIWWKLSTSTHSRFLTHPVFIYNRYFSSGMSRYKYPSSTQPHVCAWTFTCHRKYSIANVKIYVTFNLKACFAFHYHVDGE